MQDFSPALLTNVQPVLENWTKPYSWPSATPSSLILFFFWMWSALVLAGGVVHPRVLALRYPDESGSALLPVFEFEELVLLTHTESDFSFSDIDPCLGSPQEWSPKYEVHSEVALHVHYHKVGKDEGTINSYEHIFDYPLGVSNCWICKLHEHRRWGMSWVMKFFEDYLGHYIYTWPQITKALLVVFVVDKAADLGDPWIFLHCCH